MVFFFCCLHFCPLCKQQKKTALVPIPYRGRRVLLCGKACLHGIMNSPDGSTFQNKCKQFLTPVLLCFAPSFFFGVYKTYRSGLRPLRFATPANKNPRTSRWRVTVRLLNVSILFYFVCHLTALPQNKVKKDMKVLSCAPFKRIRRNRSFVRLVASPLPHYLLVIQK